MGATRIAIDQGLPAKLLSLVKDRLPNAMNLEPELRRMWMAAAFLVDFDDSRKAVETFCDESPENLWSLRSVIQPDRTRKWRQISLNQYAMIVQKFSRHWPPIPYPHSTSRGDTNGWNATEFIRSCIAAIGGDTNENASLILDSLVADPNVTAYLDQLKHVRAQQRKKRLDSEFNS